MKVVLQTVWICGSACIIGISAVVPAFAPVTGAVEISFLSAVFDTVGIFFVTDFDGIFLFNGEKVERFETYTDDFLRANQVFCAAIYKDQLAIGTVRNGLLVKNLSDGSNIFCNTQTGLQNNTILSISFDKTGNLWLGLDKGIDYVMINSPIYDLFGNTKLYEAGYASLLRGNAL